MTGVWPFLTARSSWAGPNGIAARLAEHLWLTGVSMLLALVIALPVALVLGHTGKGGAVAINISNVGRAIPTFAIILVLSVGALGTDDFGPFGRAGLATLVSLVLFAIPPIMTNAYVGMREVDRDLVESAQGMGMNAQETFWQVELPMALPLVMTGVRLAVVQVWATATIAALVAGPGLGNIIQKGFDSNKQYMVVGGAIVVAVVAIILELSLVLVARVIDPMRRARRHRDLTPRLAVVEGVR